VYCKCQYQAAIRRCADAQAHKTKAIFTGAKGTTHFIVYLALSHHDEIQGANQRASSPPAPPAGRAPGCAHR
jgi:hypothetical protein